MPALPTGGRETRLWAWSGISASVDDDVNSPDTKLEKMEAMSDITPFKGKRDTTTAPMTVLHRFTKEGRVMEIRERNVAWKAVEFLVFLDGQLLESQLFRDARLVDYLSALYAVIQQYEEDGWVKEPRKPRQL